MNDHKLILYITKNFLLLQGLRLIPIGILVLLVSLWSNAPRIPGIPILIPLALIFLTGAAYWLVDRYYARHFGKVRQERKQVIFDLLIMAGGAICALVGVLIDMQLDLPISLVGLVVVAGLLVDYLRANWHLGLRILWFYPIAALLILFASLAPLIFGNLFWHSLGITEPLHGVLILTGFSMVLIGIGSHSFLKRTLTPLNGR